MQMMFAIAKGIRESADHAMQDQAVRHTLAQADPLTQVLEALATLVLAAPNMAASAEANMMA
jgi:hypothetical protein